MDKLKAPVGEVGRKDPAVKNQPDDVNLVRLMLRENGFMVAPEGKVDPGVLKAIAAAQKKAGIKHPDKIVDPGGRTFKFLFPKYDKAAKDAAKVVMVKVTMDGKEVWVTQAEYDLAMAALMSSMSVLAGQMSTANAIIAGNIKGISDAAAAKDGYFETVADFVKSKIAPVKPFDAKVKTALDKAVKDMESAVKAKDAAACIKAVKAFDKAFGDAAKELARYAGEAMSGRQTVMKVAAFANTAVLSTMTGIAAATIVKGLDIAEVAAAKARGDIKILKTKAAEIAKQTVVKEADVVFDVTKAAFEAAFNAVSGVSSILVPAKMLEAIAQRVVKVVQTAIKMTSAQALRLVKAVLTGPAAQALTKIVHGVIQTLRPVLGGKAPTPKQVEDAVVKLVETFLKGDLVVRLQGFLKKFQAMLGKYLDTLITGIIRRLIKTAKIAADVLARIVAIVRKALIHIAEDIGREVMLIQMKGDETIDKLIDIAIKGVEKSSELIKKIEAEARKALKANQISV